MDYSNEAHRAAMTRPLGGGNYLPREQAMSIEMYEPDEAADKRKADDGAAALAAVLAVIGVVMALAVAAVVYQVWPLVMAVRL